MKIEITLDHTDLVGVTADKFCAAMYVLQGIAKSNRLTGDLAPFVKPYKPEDYPDQCNNHINQTENHKEKPVANSEESPAQGTNEKAATIDRDAIIEEIKQIARDDATRNKSTQIRECITAMGFAKLHDIPDDKLPMLLEKVKSL